MSSYPPSIIRLGGALVLLLLGAALSQSGHAQGQAPEILSLDPDRGRPGSTLNVAIGGTGFVQGATADFGAGVTTNSAVVSAPDGIGPLASHILTVNITIAGNATPGARNVLVTNPDGQNDTASGGFTVEALSQPTISGVSPGSGKQGGTLSVIISGRGFIPGATADYGPGIRVNSAVVQAPSGVGPLADHILATNITIASDAAVTARDVMVTNPDGGSATLAQTFRVLVGDPGKLIVSPSKVSFPATRVGRTRTKKLKVKNGGRGALTGTFTFPGAPFSVTPTATSFSLAPGKSTTLSVVFSPSAVVRSTGAVDITSSDPRRPSKRIAVTGKGK